MTIEMTTTHLARTMGQRVFTGASENGGDFWAAAERAWDSLGASEQRQIGIWALVTAERDAFRVLHPTENGNGGHVTLVTQNAYAPFSRRRLALAGADPLSYVVAIGNTGNRKPIGELTREDLYLMAGYYGANKRAYAEKEALWRRIAAKVPEGKTVADARLSRQDRAMLLAECGAEVVAA